MRIARLQHKLRRFGELSGPDKGLLLRAVVWLAIARVRLAVTPFPKLVERLSAEQGDLSPTRTCWIESVLR